jgi:hypothetical protein
LDFMQRRCSALGTARRCGGVVVGVGSLSTGNGVRIQDRVLFDVAS